MQKLGLAPALINKWDETRKTIWAFALALAKQEAPVAAKKTQNMRLVTGAQVPRPAFGACGYPYHTTNKNMRPHRLPLEIKRGLKLSWGH